jgi:hypothetical protein
MLLSASNVCSSPRWARLSVPSGAPSEPLESPVQITKHLRGGFPMFARVVEFVPRYEKKDEFIKTMKNEVLPILKKQIGFLDILPLFPEIKNEKAVHITLWMEKRDAERYEKEVFPRVEDILRPFLTTPITWKLYNVETALCEHFVNALAA